MPTILFRADGGPSCGMGHLMRCRTLAIEMQRRGWKPVFLADGVPKSGFDGLENRPFTILHPTEHGSGGFAAAQVAEKVQAAVVVIDTYAYGMKDYLALWKGGRPLVAIDDLADRGLPVDVVVNPNPLFPDTRYRDQGIPNCLVGEKYTLIRPEILVVRDRPPAAKRRLLVTLGGGGVPDVLMPALACIGARDFEQICVMAATPESAIERWVAENPAVRTICRDWATLPERLAEADAVVTAGGTTLWEVYCVGRASLAIVWVENQRQALQVVQSRQTGIVADLRRGFDEAAFTEAWKRFLQSLDDESCRQRQRELIDGMGAVRVAEAILKMD